MEPKIKDPKLRRELYGLKQLKAIIDATIKTLEEYGSIPPDTDIEIHYSLKGSDIKADFKSKPKVYTSRYEQEEDNNADRDRS